MVDQYHTYKIDRWRHQLRLRAEASRTLVIPGARLNPVVWLDEAALIWATPFVEGRHGTDPEVVGLAKGLDASGLGFIADVNPKNVIADERFGGLVVIDFQVYERGYVAFKSVMMNAPPKMYG